MPTYRNVIDPPGTVGGPKIRADLGRTLTLLAAYMRTPIAAKLARWHGRIAAKEPMPMPDLAVDRDGLLVVMDGRHRLRALADTGHTHAWVTCEADQEANVRALVV